MDSQANTQLQEKTILRPKVGIAAIACQNGRILMGQRKSAHGDGTWSFPGGHMEYGETFELTAIRECKEECGLTLKDARVLCVTNDFFRDESKHYITVFVTGQVSGTPIIKEPGKMVKWSWYSWNKFPEPLFLPVKNLKKIGVRPIGL